VLKLISDLTDAIPQSVDVGALKHKLRNDDSPLNVVLVQELQRYNILLNVLRNSLEQLEKGIKGLVLISPDLEAVLNSLFENKVPKSWSFAYFSLKPLATWMRDLADRYAFLAQWGAKGAPHVFWIGAFTYPTGFTTSLLQRYSRKAGSPSIDKLEFDFVPVPRQPKDITEPPKDGSYITGLYLEGAKWNFEKMCLMEPDVMELTVLMPVIQFKPIQKRVKAL
jgi:dynein heavy chain